MLQRVAETKGPRAPIGPCLVRLSQQANYIVVCPAKGPIGPMGPQGPQGSLGPSWSSQVGPGGSVETLSSLANYLGEPHQGIASEAWGPTWTSVGPTPGDVAWAWASLDRQWSRSGVQRGPGGVLDRTFWKMSGIGSLDAWLGAQQGGPVGPRGRCPQTRVGRPQTWGDVPPVWGACPQSQ